MISQRLVRVQEKGQVTLPSDLRKKLGLKKGDLVAISETADAILIAPQEVIGSKALYEIGASLKKQGLSIEVLIDRGCDERAKPIHRQYVIAADSSDERQGALPPMVILGAYRLCPPKATERRTLQL